MGLAPFPKKGQHSFIMTSCLFPGRQRGLSKCHSGELQHPQTAAALQMVGGNAVLGTWGGCLELPFWQHKVPHQDPAGCSSRELGEASLLCDGDPRHSGHDKSSCLQGYSLNLTKQQISGRASCQTECLSGVLQIYSILHITSKKQLAWKSHLGWPFSGSIKTFTYF